MRNHLLDVEGEVAEVGVGVLHRVDGLEVVELGGHHFTTRGAGGVGPVGNRPFRQDQHRRPEAVTVFDQEDRRFRAELLDVSGRLLGDGVPGGLQQLPGPVPAPRSLPYGLSFEAGDGGDPGLTSPAPLDHRLHRLEGVDAVGLQSGKTDGHGFAQIVAVVLEPGVAPQQRHRRPGHERRP